MGKSNDVQNTTKVGNEVLADVSGMLPDAIEFAIWLRDNFSSMSAQRGGKWLHKRYWRRDFTDEVLDVDTLYKEWVRNYR